MIAHLLLDSVEQSKSIDIVLLTQHYPHKDVFEDVLSEVLEWADPLDLEEQLHLATDQIGDFEVDELGDFKGEMVFHGLSIYYGGRISSPISYDTNAYSSN